ncbi:hypothetical protein EBR57_03825 [bacterium]|nr:hypothetical protein [bacterium]
MRFSKLAAVAVGILFVSMPLSAATRRVPSPNFTQPITLKSVMKSVSALLGTENMVATRTSVMTASSDYLIAVRVSGNRTLAAQFVIDSSMIRVGEELNPYRISRAVKNVQSLGVFKEVRTEVVKTRTGKELLFKVIENPMIGTVSVQGVTAFTQAQLLEKLGSRSGDLLNLIQVRKDLKLIEQLYRDAGYDEAKVVGFTAPATDRDPLVFEVSEGVLERVEVTGNARTKDYVILREMVSKPGQPINGARLRQDFQRIQNLGYFASIVPQTRAGTSPNSMVLVWEVEERENTGTFTLGGGFSPTAGFSFFSDVYWDNLFGTGQLVSAKAQLGRLSTYELKYFNPWMWDERKSFTTRLWSRDGQVDQFLPNSNSVGYRNEQSNGVSFEFGWPFTYEFGSFHSVKYEAVTLKDVGKSYTLTSYGFGLTYDTRDIRFNPLSGMYYTFRVEKAFNVSPESLDMTRFDLDLRTFFKLADQQTLATRFAIGYLTSPVISDEDLFVREYYRVGGSNSVRGWNDYYPFSIGNKQLLSSVEYRYIFNDVFQAVGFVDAGFATTGSLFDLTQMRIGKGIGIRFTIPMLGPIRLDWAMGDIGESFVHVSIGHAF